MARTEHTVYPKKCAHGFIVLCFVVVMQSFIMNSHEVFIHIHQGCFAGTGAIVRLPQCQWSKPDGYGKISQCITTTKHSKALTVCIFLGIYCTYWDLRKNIATEWAFLHLAVSTKISSTITVSILDSSSGYIRYRIRWGVKRSIWAHQMVARLMSLMASLVTTSRMQQCFNVPIVSYHEFLLLFYCCVLLEIKLTTTTTNIGNILMQCNFILLLSNHIWFYFTIHHQMF